MLLDGESENCFLRQTLNSLWRLEVTHTYENTQEVYCSLLNLGVGLEAISSADEGLMMHVHEKDNSIEY